MQFHSLLPPKEFIEAAFAHARKQAVMKRVRASAIQHRKMKATRKMELFVEYLDKQLEFALKSVPRFDELHAFYQELLPETVEITKLKQSMSQMVSVRKLLKKQLMIAKRGMHSPASDALPHMHRVSASFFGRSASIVKSLDKSISILNEANRLVKEVPDIRTDIPTVIFAGYPNVGKSTLLNKVTGSKAKVASYPFTTKSIQLGYFTMRYRDVQAIDTPGLLDRAQTEYSPIEKKAIAALTHLATAIVFVIDPTSSAGYTLEKQYGLYDRIKQRFAHVPFILVINKCDIAQGNEIENAKKLFGEECILEGHNLPTPLKDAIGKALGILS